MFFFMCKSNPNYWEFSGFPSRVKTLINPGY